MKQLHSDRNIRFFVYIFKCKKRNVGSKIIQEEYTYPITINHVIRREPA